MNTLQVSLCQGLDEGGCTDKAAVWCFVHLVPYQRTVQCAFTDLAARHDILRTRFPANDGQATIVVHAPTEIDVPLTDLTGLDRTAQNQAIKALQIENAQGSLDITAAPPWHVSLLRCAPQSHVLMITLHHILADEWSFGLMLQELNAGYARAIERTPMPAPDALQYADFSAWQRDLDLGAERDFWRWQLESAPTLLPLPTDFSRPTRRSASGGRVAVTLTPETTARLRDFARAQSSTLFICLIATYAAFLHRHTDEDDIVIGTPVSNRNVPETQGMMGLFVNTLAIRTGFEPDLTFAALLARTRETVLAAHANQTIPFEQVIDALNLPRNESHAPLVQTLFSMQTLPEAGDLYPGLTWSPEPAVAVNARLDLSLPLRDTGETIAGYFEYASDLFTQEAVQRFAARFEALLTSLLDGVEMPICDVSAMPESERIQIETFAHGPEGVPNTFPECLIVQDRDALAVDWDGVVLTYGTLQQRFEAGEPLIPEIRRLGAVLSELMQSSVEIGDLFVHQPGMMQLGAAPVHPKSRLLWKGETIGAGLVQVLSALCNGAALVDETPDARIDPYESGYELTQSGQCTRFFSPAELPMALTTEGNGPDTGANLGVPQPNVLAHVLHREGQLAPLGVVGELCLGGSALARGYVGSPARTAARFQPNRHVNPQEFHPDESCLWRSGLLVRRDVSGVLKRVGCIDDQVQIAGQRISPKQIENCIASHAAVAEVALKLPQVGQGQLEAVLVLRPGAQQPGDIDLTRHGLEHLPDYLVPRRFHWVESLPRDENGVVDDAFLAGVGGDKEMAPPVGPVEQDLAAIWCGALRLDFIGRHDNFFELGGDSILAMQIVSRMAEAGYQVEPRDLFHHQTVATLAQIARNEGSELADLALPEIEGLDMDALATSVSFGDA